MEHRPIPIFSINTTTTPKGVSSPRHEKSSYTFRRETQSKLQRLIVFLVQIGATFGQKAIENKKGPKRDYIQGFANPYKEKQK